MHITARTCPLDPETGEFQSAVAEATYKEAVRHGITDRMVVQQILQAHNAAEDRSKAEYEAWKQQRAADEPTLLLVSLKEEERQFVLLSMSTLSLDRPGFEHFARQISVKLQGEPMFDSFREANKDDRPLEELGGSD